MEHIYSRRVFPRIMSNKREGKRRHILTLNQPLEQAYPQEHQVPEKPKFSVMSCLYIHDSRSQIKELKAVFIINDKSYSQLMH
jgi:hypothetical protein